MIAKPFDSITASDVTSLVGSQVREGKSIEYKEQLPGGRDEDKKEFLADVTSFANASGGDLIFGVTEERDVAGKPTGIPLEAKGLAGINIDQEIRRLENIIRDGAEPRIPAVQIRAIEGFIDGPVLIIRISRSWIAPHMVAFKASPRFFVRSNAGKSPLDVGELRAAFVQSELIPERIRRFRDQRLGSILAGETPVKLMDGAKIVLHLVPLNSFGQSQCINPLAVLDGQVLLSPLGASGYSRRLNLDGIVTHDRGAEPPAEAFAYTQLFRDGVIEAVDSEVLSGHGESMHYIPSIAYEQYIIDAFRCYLNSYKKLEVAGPFVVFLSMLNVRRYYMHTDAFSRADSQRVERDHIILPETIIESAVDDSPRAIACRDCELVQ